MSTSPRSIPFDPVKIHIFMESLSASVVREAPAFTVSHISDVTGALVTSLGDANVIASVVREALAFTVSHISDVTGALVTSSNDANVILF